MVWADKEEEVGLGGGCDWAANAAGIRQGVQCHPRACACKNSGAGDHLPYRLAIYIAGLEESRCAASTAVKSHSHSFAACGDHPDLFVFKYDEDASSLSPDGPDEHRLGVHGLQVL